MLESNERGRPMPTRVMGESGMAWDLETDFEFRKKRGRIREFVRVLIAPVRMRGGFGCQREGPDNAGIIAHRESHEQNGRYLEPLLAANELAEAAE